MRGRAGAVRQYHQPTRRSPAAERRCPRLRSRPTSRSRHTAFEACCQFSRRSSKGISGAAKYVILIRPLRASVATANLALNAFMSMDSMALTTSRFVAAKGRSSSSRSSVEPPRGDLEPLVELRRNDILQGHPVRQLLGVGQPAGIVLARSPIPGKVEQQLLRVAQQVFESFRAPLRLAWVRGYLPEYPHGVLAGRHLPEARTRLLAEHQHDFQVRFVDLRRCGVRRWLRSRRQVPRATAGRWPNTQVRFTGGLLVSMPHLRH